MVTQVRIGDVADRQALTRLAAKARTDGIKLFRDKSGRYFASSASTPGTLHYVTGYSCDCIGFVTHQRCKHHAALMVALGWLGPDRCPDPDPQPEPDPPATAMSTPCSECSGHGQVSGTVSTSRTSWRYDSITCPDCFGTGKRVADREVA